MKQWRPVIFIIYSFLLCGSVSALENKIKPNKQPRKIYVTKRINPHPPVLDGMGTDIVWSKVEWSSNFTQTRPNEGEPPTEQTSFKILYDDDNLYVLIRAHDTQADKIAQIMARKDHFIGDMVEINIDSDHDQQTAFSFTGMASGVKGDEAITQNGRNWDSSWNPVWYLATSVDSEGWTAEMKIPFSQLRFGNKEEHVWGIQIMRNLFRKTERSHWQFIPQDSPGQVHLFGELRGIKNIKPSRQIELLPYTVGSTQRFQKEAGNPFADGSISSLSTGLDGKIGITNDLTLDFTVNPDFGQVEADPSQVNLTAFESYFSERRPFFIEGKSIYEFRPSRSIVINRLNSDNLFYSRRIGRSPHLYPNLEDGEYADIPDATTILGAFKLSGKTKDGISIGLMETVTAKEKADIDLNGARRKETVEPMTNYFVGRVQKDFDKGNTILGAIVTAVNRNINNPDMKYLHKAAYSGGIDFLHNWKEKTYYVGIKGVFSRVEGDRDAIISTQTSSARYFQRPDANYLSVDSAATSLAGYGGTVKFGRRGNGRIQFETSATMRSPGFEINDMGYMRYADRVHHGTWVGYYVHKPFWIFNNFHLNNNYWLYWNFNGDNISKHINTNFNAQFKNMWHINGSFTITGEGHSPTRLRGGPAFIEPGSWEANLNISSDHRKKLNFNMGGYIEFGDHKSFQMTSLWAGATFRPTNALRLSIYPNFNINKNELQYISCMNGESSCNYLFGKIDQKTISASIRINLCLTPNLTIEYYGQPFNSAAKYSELKRIVSPGAKEYESRFHTFTGNEISYDVDTQTYDIDYNDDGAYDYTQGNPDFNISQWRSNLVIRWEYMPGSTLYLVWSQSRTQYMPDGTFNFSNNMRDLFSVHPHNVFLLKFNRWFSL
ncbi:carbohydrate binding family 9 domain-containing protein [bacterium]|nr:carbohydrate binding family 9 domain-containing protein [bacterium]